MNKHILNFAKKIYLNTPFRSLRSFYYRIFCALVRNRTVQISVDEITYKLDLGEVIDLHIYLQKYETDLTAAIERCCKPGFIVLDIGANIGAHALRFAKIAGDSGKVYAFEPTDYAYNKLLHNISLNQFTNITPVRIALSDKNLTQQSVRFKSSWPTNGKFLERESIVDFMKLDDWCEKENVGHVDVIKLDVDGNEYSVITGAKSLLIGQRPLILMEVWGPNFSDDFKNPFVVLKQLGYRFFHIQTGQEYASVNDLRAIVSSDGKILDYSFEIIARYQSDE